MSPEKTRFSAVIPTGGKSSRMGRNKLLLPLNGKTLTEIAAEKMMALGCTDIILAGNPVSVPQTRIVQDIHPGTGPLAGIHAGLAAAQYESVFILAPDMPLVTQKLLSVLLGKHLQNGAPCTVLSHGGKLEPLLGVYEKRLAPLAEQLLSGPKSSVRRFMETAGFETVEWTGEETALLNCNTPEDYEKLCALMKSEK